MEELIGERERLSTVSGITPESYKKAIRAAQDEAAALYNDLDNVLAQAVKAFAAQEPDLRDVLARVNQLPKDVRAAFERRYQGKPTSRFRSAYIRRYGLPH